jgi:hypothetical protein
MSSTRLWVGLDVHKESIAVAVFEGTRSEGRPVVTIRNDPAQVRKLLSRLRKEGEVRACYEAGRLIRGGTDVGSLREAMLRWVAGVAFMVGPPRVCARRLATSAST